MAGYEYYPDKTQIQMEHRTIPSACTPRSFSPLCEIVHRYIYSLVWVISCRCNQWKHFEGASGWEEVNIWCNLYFSLCIGEISNLSIIRWLFFQPLEICPGLERFPLNHVTRSNFCCISHFLFSLIRTNFQFIDFMKEWDRKIVVLVKLARNDSCNTGWTARDVRDEERARVRGSN